MTDKIVVMVTVGNAHDASELAKSLLEKRLVACVNQVPGMTSWYWWEDKVTEDQEILLFMKSTRQMFPELDRAGWFGINEAHTKILKGQAVFLDRLLSVIVNS